MVSGVVEEVRALFKRGEYESVVTRSEQLQQRSRGGRDSEDRPLLSAARAAALTHLGRTQPAAVAVADLAAIDPAHPAFEAVSAFARYARPYLAWASNQGVAPALQDLLAATDADANARRALQAQLLYRLGRYEEAAGVYRAMYADAKAALAAALKRSKPAQSKSWGLSVRRTVEPSAAPVSQAEIDSLRQSQDEIGTNLMAALVLAGRPTEALALKPELGAMYEVEYNAGCASIAASDCAAAENSMKEAERLYRAIVDDEEDDVNRGLAPILVQRAYLGHVAGDVAAAEQMYAKVVRERNADPASLAVAANNVAVAMGQLAAGKQRKLMLDTSTSQGQSDGVPSGGKSSKRDQNSALFDALKKMKATSGWDVERKLTFYQRRAMARNRAVLLVQMGRLDACRGEIDKLKSAFPNDAQVPLIEAALVAKVSSHANAVTLLQKSVNDKSDVVSAARVKLTLDGGEPERAVELLEDLFPGRAAALATASAILEDGGFTAEAMSLLERVCKDIPALKGDACRALASTCLRVGNYERAAAVLRDLLQENPADDLVLGQLVVATSHFDADKAETLSARLPPINSVADIDVDALESRPPPRKRDLARSGKSTSKEGPGDAVGASKDRSASDEKEGTTKKQNKKKKKKKRLPKNYDPNGPPPDPERWLPKTLRSSYKKKRRNRELNFRGAQGADAAAADAAAARNAERSAARAAESASESVRAPASNMPKGTKSKKKTRRR